MRYQYLLTQQLVVDYLLCLLRRIAFIIIIIINVLLYLLTTLFPSNIFNPFVTEVALNCSITVGETFTLLFIDPSLKYKLNFGYH